MSGGRSVIAWAVAMLFLGGAVLTAAELRSPTTWRAKPDPASWSLDWTPSEDFSPVELLGGDTAVYPLPLAPFVATENLRPPRRVTVWDLRSGEVHGQLDLDLPFGSSGLRALSPNGSLVARADRSGSVVIWSLLDGKKVTEIPLANTRNLRVVFADNDRLVTATSQASIEVWSIPQGKRLASFEGPRGASWKWLDLTPGGKYWIAATNGADWKSQGLAVVDMRDGKILGQVAVPHRQMYCVAASPDGQEFACIAGAPTKGGVYLMAWSLEDGRQVAKHYLGDSWKEFASKFGEGSRSRSHWDAAKLGWVPDGSGWILAMQIHVDRETGLASPIRMPDECVSREGGWSPRHLPGDYLLNLLGRRPKTRLAIVPYDPARFEADRQAIEAGGLPDDFNRPPMIRLAAEEGVPTRKLPDERVAWRHEPSAAPVVSRSIRAEPISLEYDSGPPDAGVYVRKLAFPSDRPDELYAVFGRFYSNDVRQWRVTRYDLASQEERETLALPSWARPIDFSPSGKTVLTYTEDGRFDVWRFSDGQHVMGLRPTPRTSTPVYVDFHGAILVDDDHLLLTHQGTLTLLAMPDGKAIYRIDDVLGPTLLPTPDRRAVFVHHDARWTVLDTASGETLGRVALRNDSRTTTHASLSLDGRQLAVILPREEDGRLTPAVAVIDLQTGTETSRVALSGGFGRGPKWIGPDHFLVEVDHLIPTPLQDGLGAQATWYAANLVLHVPTGLPIEVFAGPGFRGREVYANGSPLVWFDCFGRSGLVRPGQPQPVGPERIIGFSLPDDRALVPTDKTLQVGAAVRERSRLALDIEMSLPSISLSLRTMSSGYGLVDWSEDRLEKHFRVLFEEQAIEIDADAEHRLSIRFQEETLDREISTETLLQLRPWSVAPFFPDETRKTWLAELLAKEGKTPLVRRLVCRIALVDAEGRSLAAAEQTYQTDDVVQRYLWIAHDRTLDETLRRELWRPAATWVMNLSAQAILSGRFDQRETPFAEPPVPKAPP